MKRNFEGRTGVYQKLSNRVGVKRFKKDIQMECINHEIKMLKAIDPKFFITLPIYSWRYPELKMFDADCNLFEFLMSQKLNPSFNQIINHILINVSYMCAQLNSQNIFHGDTHLANIVILKRFPYDIYPHLYFIDTGFSDYYIDNDQQQEKYKLQCKIESFNSETDIDEFNDRFYRKPFQKDVQYDWFLFLFNLFQCFPITKTHDFFSHSIFIALQQYIDRYAKYDRW